MSRLFQAHPTRNRFSIKLKIANFVCPSPKQGDGRTYFLEILNYTLIPATRNLDNSCVSYWGKLLRFTQQRGLLNCLQVRKGWSRATGCLFCGKAVCAFYVGGFLRTLPPAILCFQAKSALPVEIVCSIEYSFSSCMFFSAKLRVSRSGLFPG